jgi:hypothetical protein
MGLKVLASYQPSAISYQPSAFSDQPIRLLLYSPV